MYRIICNMPGMGNLLRCRDLPSFCRPGTEGNLSMDWVWFQTKQSLAADAVILNTFEAVLKQRNIISFGCRFSHVQMVV